MTSIISIKWLKEHLQNPEIIILDCRFVLQDPMQGEQQFKEGHIPRAQYMNLEQDLSAPLGKHGGRHPLPSHEALCVTFGRAGITRAKTVVVYDDQGGAMASRCWWLLKYAGHEKCFVLDEGYSAWINSGGAVSKEDYTTEEIQFEAQWNDSMLVSMERVKRVIEQKSAVLIDSREEVRYKGLAEPIDSAAGHIPTAVNAFWKDSHQTSGEWKPSDQQEKRFKQYANQKDQEIIVYCGSGVTACPNILALQEAGYTNVKLYAGSWSDWISYEGNPIANG
jgi:thiosulfate/3-mercaptopyruvate sulfurtransferase